MRCHREPLGLRRAVQRRCTAGGWCREADLQSGLTCFRLFQDAAKVVLTCRISLNPAQAESPHLPRRFRDDNVRQPKGPTPTCGRTRQCDLAPSAQLPNSRAEVDQPFDGPGSVGRVTDER
jgi:hypothetical protein